MQTFQNMYTSVPFGLCLQVWLLLRMNEDAFETVCQCLTIAFHLSAVSYKHSFTQFIQFVILLDLKGTMCS